MDTKGAPALLPALGCLAGTWLAARLEVPPGPACVLLAAAGLALRHPAGRLLAFLVLGMVNGEVRWIEPGRSLAALRQERPVELVAEVDGHPLRRPEETLLYVRSRYLRQNDAVYHHALEIAVTLPAGVEAPALGTTVRIKGYLRRSPGFANQPHIRPGPWRLRLKSARFLVVEKRPGPVSAMAARLRQASEAAIGEVAERTSTTSGGGLLLARALLLGERSELPLSWRQTLRRFGLTHLLAVSGLHVGLLAVLVLAAARRLPRLPRYLLGAVAVTAYLLLIGPRPAVLRASIMALLALASLVLHRPPQSLNALAWCLLALIVPSPGVIAELGFQLSFAATAALIVVSPRLAERWRGLPKAVRLPLAASVAAQLATVPLLLPYTGTVHPLAAVANLVAIPWLALFLLVAFPWLVAAVVDPGAAQMALPWLDALAWPLELLAQSPPSGLDLQLMSVDPAVGWLAGALAAAVAWWPRRAALAGLIVLLLAMTGAPRPAGGAAAELIVLDAGQGDAVVLRDGERAMLIDGGGWPQGDFGGRVLLPALAAQGVRRLDAVVMTHPDLDHCGGLADLVRYLPVARILISRVVLEAGEAAVCTERLLAAPGSEPRPLERGDTLQLGRWRLEVLHPAAGDVGKANDLSLVLRASIGRRSVLLTGDLEAAGERLMMRRGGELRSDVLKVAHHGSKSSTSTAWLRAVEPRIALVSAGVANHYGHPAPAVLARLSGAGVRVLRTDRSGRLRLRFEPDGRISIDLPVLVR